MKPRSLALFAVVSATTACTPDEELGAQLLVPDDIGLHWDERFNDVDDGLGALIPVDLMVYEGHSGEPVSDEALNVEIHSYGSVVAFPEHVELSAGSHWDAYRDRYFSFEPADGPASELILSTDEHGLARAYIYVDAFPVDEGDFTPVHVLVSSGLAEDAFFLVPQ